MRDVCENVTLRFCKYNIIFFIKIILYKEFHFHKREISLFHKQKSSHNIIFLFKKNNIIFTRTKSYIFTNMKFLIFTNTSFRIILYL